MSIVTTLFLVQSLISNNTKLKEKIAHTLLKIHEIENNFHKIIHAQTETYIHSHTHTHTFIYSGGGRRAPVFKACLNFPTYAAVV